MYSVTKSYWFSAAHRLENHPKCGRLHGHNYKVSFTFTSPLLDGDGMIVDFGSINKLVEPYIDALDHRYIVSFSNRRANCLYWTVANTSGKKNDYVHINMEASTAECLAEFLFNEVTRTLVMAGENPLNEYDDVDLVEVTVWETPRAFATFRPS